MPVTDDLTAAQTKAVLHRDGPLLVLAGPGSGKTRVVTRRIAALIEQGVPPQQIVAITFTNKAAREMQERVAELLQDDRVWISTFHRFCARLLRRHAQSVGLASNFTILDPTDQKQVMRRILSDLDFDSVHFPPEKVLWRISAAKNDLVTPEQYSARFQEIVADHWQAVVEKAYPVYQQTLLAANTVDFDDLLLHVAVLLEEQEELCLSLSERFRYVLVDEYQDTNRAQYQIAAGLASSHGNLCVTGDPDQSIYGWRGARIENILRFERDFPNATVVRLEENFRSTSAILRSADQLIANNSRRKSKRLFSHLGEGEPVRIWRYPSAEIEAEETARWITRLVQSGARRYSDFAICYRINSLSRQMELALVRHRIPFQIASGFAFYDRAEVKDLLAYLRLISNPSDQAAFSRVVNTPLRGLGKTSQDRLIRWASEHGLGFLEAAVRASEVPRLSRRAALGFRRFAEMIDRFSLADSGSVAGLLEKVIAETRLASAWVGSPSETDQQRLANIEELVAMARTYDAYAGDEKSLEGFLEQTSLVNETDSLDPAAGQVTLLTLHSAKGLEFPCVRIIGVEQGLIPHDRSIGGDADPHELEEERRLLFVGMTRAQELLHLSFADRRALHGRERLSIPSPFLREFDAELVEVDEPVGHEPSPLLPPPRERRETPATLGDLKSRLKTGADLLNGTQSAVELPNGFAVGSQVRHPRYGVGSVIGVSGFGLRRTISVRFQDGRTQDFVAAHAPLQPLG